MKPNNYFCTLEELSENSLQSVRKAFSSSKNRTEDICELQKSSFSKLSSLENLLFSDFLPPLERDSIAIYAHSLVKIIPFAAERASLSKIRTNENFTEKEKVCISLAAEIRDNTYILKKLKKPEEIPNVRRFRELLLNFQELHQKELFAIASGRMPKSSIEANLATGRLCLELSACFDKLLEIMLNNI